MKKKTPQELELSPRKVRAEMERIRDLCIDYLDTAVPKFLHKLVEASGDNLSVKVAPCEPSHVFSARYHLRSEGREVCTVWVGLNVFHAYIVYFFPRKDGTTLADFERMFHFMVSAPASQGWVATWDPIVIGKEEIVVLTLDNDLPRSFIELPAKRIQIAREVAEITRSVMEIASRNGFQAKTKAAPDLLPVVAEEL